MLLVHYNFDSAPQIKKKNLTELLWEPASLNGRSAGATKPPSAILQLKISCPNPKFLMLVTSNFKIKR